MPSRLHAAAVAVLFSLLACLPLLRASHELIAHGHSAHCAATHATPPEHSTPAPTPDRAPHDSCELCHLLSESRSFSPTIAADAALPPPACFDADPVVPSSVVVTSSRPRELPPTGPPALLA